MDRPWCQCLCLSVKVLAAHVGWFSFTFVWHVGSFTPTFLLCTTLNSALLTKSLANSWLLLLDWTFIPNETDSTYSYWPLDQFTHIALSWYGIWLRSYPFWSFVPTNKYNGNRSFGVQGHWGTLEGMKTYATYRSGWTDIDIGPVLTWMYWTWIWKTRMCGWKYHLLLEAVPFLYMVWSQQKRLNLCFRQDPFICCLYPCYDHEPLLPQKLNRFAKIYRPMLYYI